MLNGAGSAVLDWVVLKGRTGKRTFQQSVREGALGYLGRAFQRERTASAKALGQECAWPSESSSVQHQTVS